MDVFTWRKVLATLSSDGARRFKHTVATVELVWTTACGCRVLTGVGGVQGAPHTAAVVLGDDWKKPYSREAAAFPAAWVRQSKFWPTTGEARSAEFL
jgi:hypothetical protein